METTEMAVAAKTVRDVMQTDVLTVEPELTVGELMKTLMERGISGAPVVDHDGSVLGVVSTTDVLRLALRDEEKRNGDHPDSEDDENGFYMTPEGTAHYPSVFFPGLPRTRLASRPIREIMTPVTFSVKPQTSLAEIARFLLRGKIHRALVFENRQLVGLVTTLDLVRAIAES